MRDAAFWKAFAVGVAASPNAAERELFRVVMKRLASMV